MDIIEEPQRNEIQEHPNNINKQNAQHNISNFTLIKVKGDGNCLPRAILKSINLEENHHRIIREEIAKAIQEHIWE